MPLYLCMYVRIYVCIYVCVKWYLNIYINNIVNSMINNMNNIIVSIILLQHIYYNSLFFFYFFSVFLFYYSHAENSDESVKLMSTGYLCPQCFSKHCELPVECRACGLTLVSAPHLARSYHYLFPVEPFKEVAFEGNHSFCFGCQKTFTQKDKKVFLFDMTLQNCIFFIMSR